MAFIQSMQVSTDDRDALLTLAAEDDGLGRIVEMAHQWLFKSETYDNCNCAVNCGTSGLARSRTETENARSLSTNVRMKLNWGMRTIEQFILRICIAKELRPPFAQRRIFYPLTPGITSHGWPDLLDSPNPHKFSCRIRTNLVD